jgi:ArsR family transcriptional regulator, arsenate/arsenite/antimonite-responsive transcriptional repressor
MQADALSSLFKALSEPVRVQLMALLLARGELCVCDLVDALALPQSLVSRHLACLRRQALVTATRRGVWMHYQIAPEAREQLAPVLQMLSRLPVAAPDGPSRCC